MAKIVEVSFFSTKTTQWFDSDLVNVVQVGFGLGAGGWRLGVWWPGSEAKLCLAAK